MLSSEAINSLIVRSRAGCKESLGSLLEMYRSYLRLLASLQLNHQFQEKFSPSDIVQSAFMEAHRGFEKFRGETEAELTAWLRKILASQMLMEIRRYSTLARDANVERKLYQQVNQSSACLAAMVSANGETPSQTAMKRERAVLLANALSQLPANYREIIVLRHLRAYRFSEVAEEMNQSVDSVKAMWQRAIKRLRELLGDNAF